MTDQESRGDGLDEYLQKVLGIVKQYGWTVQGVLGQFSYTAGLFRPEMGCHPELTITVPLPAEIYQPVLNSMGLRIKDDGERFQPGPVEDVLGGGVRTHLLAVEDVRDEEYPLGVANALFGGVTGRVQALQLVIADARGHFPWEPGYNAIGQPQYLMGQPPIPA